MAVRARVELLVTAQTSTLKVSKFALFFFLTYSCTLGVQITNQELIGRLIQGTSRLEDSRGVKTIANGARDWSPFPRAGSGHETISKSLLFGGVAVCGDGISFLTVADNQSIRPTHFFQPSWKLQYGINGPFRGVNRCVDRGSIYKPRLVYRLVAD